MANDSKATEANPQQYYSVLKKPLVTEKTTMQQELRNQYAFAVDPDTNKVEVRKAVEVLFGVRVKAVNIVRMPSKRKRMFGRPGLSRPWKKAIVTLHEGDAIEVA